MYSKTISDRMRDPPDRQFGLGVDRSDPPHIAAPRRRIDTINHQAPHLGAGDMAMPRFVADAAFISIYNSVTLYAGGVLYGSCQIVRIRATTRRVAGSRATKRWCIFAVFRRRQISVAIRLLRHLKFVDRPKNSVDPPRSEFDTQALEIQLSSAPSPAPFSPENAIFAVISGAAGMRGRKARSPAGS